MVIYLSEESVNSLFKVVNETNVSGSYDEKVNRLKISGVLSDSQDFTCHQTLNKMPHAGNYQKALDSLDLSANICKAVQKITGIRSGKWLEIAKAFEYLFAFGIIDRELYITAEAYQSQKNAAILIAEYGRKLESQWPDQGYLSVVEEILTGKAPVWATAVQAALKCERVDFLKKAEALMERYKALGISLKQIANELSEKLANFFSDGTYNYTLIMFPTVVYPNGDVGNGTCQITSIYDGTQGLVQKLVNQNYQSSINNKLRTLLKTLDISSNFSYIGSDGSSAFGKYFINDNICKIMNYGYSVSSGGFTKFKYIFIKTNIGFIKTTYVLHDNGTETLRTIVYFTKV